MTGTEIQTTSGQPSALVLPVADKEQLVAAMRAYQLTKDSILEDSDYQKTPQGRFIKKSGYAKLAIAFGASSEIVRREYETDADGTLIGAEFVVRATAPNGRYAEGWGYCSIDEPRFKQPAARQKIKHDLPATSETRARNRAYAALFGHGEVSYEEMDSGDTSGTARGSAKQQMHDALQGLVTLKGGTERDYLKAAVAALGLSAKHEGELSDADRLRIRDWVLLRADAPAVSFEAVSPETRAATVPAPSAEEEITDAVFVASGQESLDIPEVPADPLPAGVIDARAPGPGGKAMRDMLTKLAAQRGRGSAAWLKEALTKLGISARNEHDLTEAQCAQVAAWAAEALKAGVVHNKQSTPPQDEAAPAEESAVLQF